MIMLKPDDPQVVELIRAGKIGVIPTDTLYGIVAAAALPEAVERVYALRRKPDSEKPFILLAADTEQIKAFGVDEGLIQTVARFWPARLSAVFPTPYPSLKYLHRGMESLAFRIPDDAGLREVLKQTGPLVAPSANPEGMPTAPDITSAYRYFGDKVDFYVDGGELSGRKPSTLVSVHPDGELQTIRPGAVTI